MKATCSIEKMKNAVSYTERITGKNVTLPVLSSILITAHEDSLVFRSTNLSIGVEVTIPAKVETVGKVLIPGDVLSSTISNLVDVKKSTTLEIVNGNLVLSTSHGSVTVKGVPDDDFPTIPTVEGETLSIPSKILLEGIRSVFYSASPSDIRPEISSVYLYSEEDLLVFVATDSFRLAEKKIKIKGLSTVNGIIIPLKNTQEIVRILGDFDTTVLVSFSKNQISFSCDGVYITSRLIDGIFPDYKQIIPKEIKTEAVALKADVVSAIKMSNVFSDKFNQSILSIVPEEKKLEFHSKNADIGESYTRIDSALKGESFEASFNQKYILDALQNIHQDSISFNTLASNKPMIVRGVGDATFMYLVMPTNR